MMKAVTSLASLLFVAVLITPFSVGALPATQEETLRQYISELQKNPEDTALREKIMRHVKAMKTAPAIPGEVDELVGQAKYVFKHAKEQKDFLDAVDAYKKALILAPWVGDYYFNLGVAQEQAGKPQDAISSFNLYLVAMPDAKDAKEIRERIGALKYLAGKSARESSPEAVAAKKQDDYETWLANLNGVRFIAAPIAWGAIGHENDPAYLVRYISGREVRWGWFYGEPASFKTSPLTEMQFNDGRWSQEIQGKQYRVPVPSFLNDQRPCTGIISDDGQFITEQCPTSRVPQTFSRVK
jgi:tetratricopeptide (TPR) repeat protein